MDAVRYYQSEVAQQGISCTVYRPSETDSYNGPNYTDEGTVTVAISDAAGQQSITTEGSEGSYDYRGLYVPRTDGNGNYTHPIRVNDELRTNSGRRYVVTVKHGVPNDVAPEVWQLGLQRANVDGL